MHPRTTVFVFLIVLLLICSSAYLLGRALPPVAQVDEVRAGAGSPPGGAPRTQAKGQAAATLTRVAAPQPPAATFTPVWTAPAARGLPQPVAEARSPTETPVANPTPTGTLTPATEPPGDVFDFALLAPVRHSSGDCPGNYILGQVQDGAGNPLPNVTLHLSDEYGNQQRQVTKSSAGEMGRYDFPLFGPARRFYLSVVDAANQPLSPVIEIPHGMGAFAQASCHGADWQRR